MDTEKSPGIAFGFHPVPIRGCISYAGRRMSSAVPAVFRTCSYPCLVHRYLLFAVAALFGERRISFGWGGKFSVGHYALRRRAKRVLERNGLACP